MNEGFSESRIVKAVADAAAKRIARRVILGLQRMHQTLSGDDSELVTTWEEICVQVQYERSFFWDAYDETVRALVAGEVEGLQGHERDALWLRTDAGWDWAYEPEDERPPEPVVDDDSVDYVTRAYIYAEAGYWSNRRIRAFIDRSSIRD
jgi:hypothetical protein